MDSAFLDFATLVTALTSLIVSYVVLRTLQEPEVVVYAVGDKTRPSVINLVIENMGKGIAREVKFKSDRPMPSAAFGFAEAPIPETMTSGPIIVGVAFLHPGEKRVITWGQYGGLNKGLGGRAIAVTASYYSTPTWGILRRKHLTVSTIDLDSFLGTDASDSNWDQKMAEHLKQISASIKSVINSSDRSIRVTTHKQPSKPVSDPTTPRILPGP